MDIMAYCLQMKSELKFHVGKELNFDTKLEKSRPCFNFCKMNIAFYLILDLHLSRLKGYPCFKNFQITCCDNLFSDAVNFTHNIDHAWFLEMGKAVFSVPSKGFILAFQLVKEVSAMFSNFILIGIIFFNVKETKNKKP